jgi:predicted alpha/beta-hydrolase family hydrolase
MTNKKESHKLSITAGIAGLTAAAIGTYFLYGHKDAVKNRAKVKGWMLKAKGEVLEELEKAGDITEEKYHGIVGSVLKKYHDLKKIDKTDVSGFLESMKDEWKEMAGVKKPQKKSKKK